MSPAFAGGLAGQEIDAVYDIADNWECGTVAPALTLTGG